MDFRKRFYLSPSEKRGFFVIFLALLLYVATNLFLTTRPLTENRIELSEKEMQEIDRFRQSREKDLGRTGQRNDGRQDRMAETFPFDPNTADSITFIRLGLAPWQARNALKYRRKGGHWKSADDFSRLYGLREDDFQRLRPYIRITADENTYRREQTAPRRDSAYARYRSQKFPEGTIIDINAADTTQLKRIPGIGSYYASKICRYRERLGGFLHIRQIKEVEGLPPDVEKWFSIEDNPQIHKINVNEADFKQLIRHPYLNYEQVKAICAYRQKYGKLKSWSELRLVEAFTADDFLRLGPYFDF